MADSSGASAHVSVLHGWQGKICQPSLKFRIGCDTVSVGKIASYVSRILGLGRWVLGCGVCGSSLVPLLVVNVLLALLSLASGQNASTCSMISAVPRWSAREKCTAVGDCVSDFLILV